MILKLIRHATLQIRYAGRTLLVDPMLGAAGTMDPTPGTANTKMNPLVELPVPVETLLAPDAVLLTHMHRDHWDPAAAEMLDKDVPIWCQPEDAERLLGQGFRHVRSIEDQLEAWPGLRVFRTGGRHGRGALGRSLGPVSGYVLKADREPTLYIAGDTVWCREVRTALETHRPDAAVVFAGAARFRIGCPVTMSERDLNALCAASPHTQVAVAHMEAWNHCGMERDGLRAFVRERGLQGRVLVPEDGETIDFA